eukprot:c35681_g1_i1 orf=44-409(+)
MVEPDIVGWTTQKSGRPVAEAMEVPQLETTPIAPKESCTQFRPANTVVLLVEGMDIESTILPLWSFAYHLCLATVTQQLLCMPSSSLVALPVPQGFRLEQSLLPDLGGEVTTYVVWRKWHL